VLDVKKPSICIGIPCYGSAPAETLEDYMRFAYHLGRRMINYEFMLAIKPKFEQFRARNAIVTAAMQMDAKYLLFLDDDQVIGWRDAMGPNDQYDFIRILVDHMENDPKLGIVGAMYYHRGQDCLPVLMKQGVDGGYYYMRDDEITNGLQDVSVTGGGCMFCRMDALLSVSQPWFVPELKYGTDIQICEKVREAGWRVKCDTSITLGHVMQKREVITPENRIRIIMESQASYRNEEQIDPKWLVGSAYNMFYLDGMEYLELEDQRDLVKMAGQYNHEASIVFPGKDGDLTGYYRSRGKLQAARQIWFHGTPVGITNDTYIMSLFKGGERYYGLDYGCGASAIGFELLMRGNRIDFIDVEGSGGIEFLKWRVKKRKLESRAGWKLEGPYDFILLMDVLEHLPDPHQLIRELVPLLKDNAVIITNYFYLLDDDNLEHISMDRDSVKKTLLECGVYPTNLVTWVKRDLGFMDRGKEADNGRNYQENNLQG